MHTNSLRFAVCIVFCTQLFLMLRHVSPFVYYHLFIQSFGLIALSLSVHLYMFITLINYLNSTLLERLSFFYLKLYLWQNYSATLGSLNLHCILNPTRSHGLLGLQMLLYAIGIVFLYLQFLDVKLKIRITCFS